MLKGLISASFLKAHRSRLIDLLNIELIDWGQTLSGLADKESSLIITFTLMIIRTIIDFILLVYLTKY